MVDAFAKVSHIRSPNIIALISFFFLLYHA